MEVDRAEYDRLILDYQGDASHPDVVAVEKRLLAAAKEAAPYQHAKLASVIIRDTNADVETLSEEELRRIVFGEKAVSSKTRNH